MPWSTCRFIKRIAEYCPMKDANEIPDNCRGLYALLKKVGRTRFDVVYIGMSAGDRAGMHSRIRSHRQHKKRKWTHFTILEVHDNITRQEIKELEGLFRIIYRKDTHANPLNKQLSFRPLQKCRHNDLHKWE